MIVVDASALVAIGDFEPDAGAYVRALEQASGSIMSVVNAVEVGLVLIGRRRLQDVDELNRWFGDLSVEVDHSGVTHDLALAAYLSFGRTYHPARLNLGDCFAYALARRLDAPLLYKGADFDLTDVKRAI